MEYPMLQKEDRKTFENPFGSLSVMEYPCFMLHDSQ